MIISKILKYKIYCDMDDVLTDFGGEIYRLGGLTIEQIFSNASNAIGEELFWDIINGGGVKFWSKMEWASNGKKLWDLISPYNPTILSAYDKCGIYTIEGKKTWIKENLGDVNSILCLREEKKNYACPNAILIDDRPKNIDEWRENKGIGILYKDSDFDKISATIKGYLG